jgi:AcrR family transcriptional regulator
MDKVSKRNEKVTDLENVQADGVADTRKQRRRNRNMDMLVKCAEELMHEKGLSVATMQEIADKADVALGTLYSYFASKDEIAIAVMEGVMKRMGVRIRAVTCNFEDPGQTFAFGIRCLLEAGHSDPSWRFLLNRPDVMADVMQRVFGRYAKADIRQAVKAKRYKVSNVDVAWCQAIWAVVGVCVALNHEEFADMNPKKIIDDAVANLLCLVGMSTQAAEQIVALPTPELPPE